MQHLKNPVRLTEEEVKQLRGLTEEEGAGVYVVRRAKILLMLDESRYPDVRVRQVAEALKASGITVRRVAQQYNDEGLERTLTMKRRATKIDKAVRANIVKITSFAPPKGRTRWSLQMIRDKLIEMRVVDSISREGVRKSLKKSFPIF